jgi:hypothetical protein
MFFFMVMLINSLEKLMMLTKGGRRQASPAYGLDGQNYSMTPAVFYL